MMKAKFLVFASVSSLVAFVGCSTTGQQEFAKKINDIQVGAIKACHFLPIAESAAMLIPVVSPVTGIVNLLCSALAQAQSAGTTRAAGAVLPGSNIAFPLYTSAGTIIVEGSLVQPGSSAPSRAAGTGIGNGGFAVERPAPSH